MTQKVIVAEGLSKKYRIHHQHHPSYTTLREALTNRMTEFYRSLTRRSRPVGDLNSSEDLWALRDVNFEIPAGSRVGIIGRNGAGKSTLLKILSRIIEPTEGRVVIRGRVSSLLEIGTGFHPELTGTENIYLNGAILGMSRAEMRQKFDRIVAFSELEKFLDTPLKRYSSGMQMRLAFAITAHLEPAILIIDEILAVGDLRFQEKCLAKLDEIGKRGCTIIFVSHDLHRMASLCDTGLFMDKGQLALHSDMETCVSQYMNTIRSSSLSWSGPAGNHLIHCSFARIRDADRNSTRPYFYRNDELTIELHYEILQNRKNFDFRFSIENEIGTPLASRTLSPKDPSYRRATAPGSHQLALAFPAGLLHEGKYVVSIQVMSNGIKIIDNAISLQFTICSKETSAPYSHHDANVVLGNHWCIDTQEPLVDRVAIQLPPQGRSIHLGESICASSLDQ